MKNVKETTLFTSKGESIGLTMLDFWKYQYSNIFDLQEHIAEFIVGKALGLTEPCNRNGWSLYDIYYRDKRIEVKETGYFYSWQEDGKSANSGHSVSLRHMAKTKSKKDKMTYMSSASTPAQTKKNPILWKWTIGNSMLSRPV